MIYLTIFLPYSFLALIAYAALSLRLIFKPQGKVTVSFIIYLFILIAYTLKILLLGGHAQSEFLPRFLIIIFMATIINFSSAQLVLRERWLNYSIFFLLAGQLLLIYHPEVLTDIVGMYRISEAEVERFGGRIGGWITNPNQLARAVTLLVILKWTLFKLRFDASIAAAGFSLILSGSRTGMAVFLLSYILILIKRPSGSNVVLAIVLSVAAFAVFSYLDGLRFAQASTDGSFGAKILPFLVLAETNSLWLGIQSNGEIEYITSFLRQEHIDSDLGNFFTLLGLIGIALPIIYTLSIFPKLDLRQVAILNWAILWMFSSSVMLNYWVVFPFLLLLTGNIRAK